MPDGYAHPEYLVETDWLAAHLDDPKLVVLDCTVHLIPSSQPVARDSTGDSADFKFSS